MSNQKVVVHRGRAHVDDFLAACVCIFKTGLDLYRVDADDSMMNDPGCWVLDQGLRFEPELHNFDHHQTEEEICALTMVLDYFYGRDYRDYVPQLSYIEIHDSHGSSAAAKFAGTTPSVLDKASSMIQSFLLKSFSVIEGRVQDPWYSIMRGMGEQLCQTIEDYPRMLESLDRSAQILHAGDAQVLDVTGCENHDRLPTKLWCKKRGISPSVILTSDPRSPGLYRMVSVDKSKIIFSGCTSCEFVHPSGFLVVFKDYDAWQSILASQIKKAAR